MLDGAAAPLDCADPAAAAGSFARATALLEVVASCGGEPPTCLEAAGPIVDTAVAEPAPECSPERASEVDAWRTVAVALVVGAMLDCRVAGASEHTTACDAPGHAMLLSSAMGALEISGGFAPGSSLLDAMATTMGAAERAGSVGVQFPMISMAMGEAVSRSMTVSACVDGPRWRAGEGLTTLDVRGTAFSLALPGGTSSEVGMATIATGQPIRVGFSTRPLVELVAAAPAECMPLDAGADSARVFDCVGSALYTPHREVWALVDLGTVRAVVVERVRHNASAMVVNATVALLRTVALRSGAGTTPLDVAALGVSGSVDAFGVVYRRDDGVLALADRIAPGAGGRSVLVTRVSTADVCARARATPVSPTREVLDDTDRADGGCELSAWTHGNWGPLLHVLRVEAVEDGFVSLEFLLPAVDSAAGRAALPDTLALLDALRGR